MKEILLAALLSAEIGCLQQIIYHEARSEGITGMSLVAAVAHNRVLSPRFPDSYCEVKKQPYQFEFLRSVSNPEEQREERSVAVSTYIAHQLVMNAPPEPLYNGILYFHGNHMTPNWNFKLLKEFINYRGHSFYHYADTRCCDD